MFLCAENEVFFRIMCEVSKHQCVHISVPLNIKRSHIYRDYCIYYTTRNVELFIPDSRFLLMSCLLDPPGLKYTK